MNGFSRNMSSIATVVRIAFARSSLAVMSLASAAAAQAQDAPFGFEWGQSLETAEAITGTQASPELLWNRVHALHTETAPSVPPDTDFISLAIDPALGLGRITWFSDDIVNDVFGNAGKEKYLKYKTILSGKYGQPTSSGEISGRELWEEADEFYQCLAYDGCGMYFTIWRAEGGLEIALQLKGLRRGQGYIEITYEGANWDRIIYEVGKAEAALEEKSF